MTTPFQPTIVRRFFGRQRNSTTERENRNPRPWVAKKKQILAVLNDGMVLWKWYITPLKEWLSYYPHKQGIIICKSLKIALHLQCLNLFQMGYFNDPR